MKEKSYGVLLKQQKPFFAWPLLIDYQPHRFTVEGLIPESEVLENKPLQKLHINGSGIQLTLSRSLSKDKPHT